MREIRIGRHRSAATVVPFEKPLDWRHSNSAATRQQLGATEASSQQRQIATPARYCHPATSRPTARKSRPGGRRAHPNRSPAAARTTATNGVRSCEGAAMTSAWRVGAPAPPGGGEWVQRVAPRRQA
eukprot:514510-Prymnesium_polylepis.1